MRGCNVADMGYCTKKRRRQSSIFIAKNKTMAFYSILNKLLDDLHALAIAEDITASKEQ